ncbi:FecR family protein [Chitinophaga sp. 22321]|uniref:FecR family protein n=1 Tax=Chitinophaga hostae TaxID=2831022 RepID=A0ABS5IYP1_9BACT|nr:FecR family protein [Chitinophaga hostae]MBS0028084.1 FecR family protein [Chitinophaga hostae]
MKHPATLLEKFFRGECSEAEIQVVKEYIMQHPEALQPWLTDDSWHSFHPDAQLPADISDKMLAVIESRTWQKKRVRTIYYKWIAAAITGALCTGLIWTVYQQLPAKKIAAVQPIAAPAATPLPYREQANNTRKTMPLRLKDGSVVELSPGSRIKYQEPFANANRHIYLSGEALFKVAPDKEKPFTVYTGNLGTTALGTVFKITAWSGKKGAVRVQLISGKVMVQPDSIWRHNGGKTTYLLPGQDLSFDPVKMMAVVSRQNKAVNTASQKVPVKPENEIFTFSNEPLANIFRLMAKKYNITIQYQENTLTDMSFTGVFDNSKESLSDFLNTIGTLNNLTIKQTNNIIYVTQ